MSKVIVVGLVLVVVAICLAPLVNLEPTALRSVKTAIALLAALTTLALLGFGIRPQQLHRPPGDTHDMIPPPEDVLNLICSRLC